MEALKKKYWFPFALGIHVSPLINHLVVYPAMYLPVYAEDLILSDFTVPLQVLKHLPLFVLWDWEWLYSPPQTGGVAFWWGDCVLKHKIAKQEKSGPHLPKSKESEVISGYLLYVPEIPDAKSRPQLRVCRNWTIWSRASVVLGVPGTSDEPCLGDKECYAEFVI